MADRSTLLNTAIVVAVLLLVAGLFLGSREEPRAAESPPAPPPSASSSASPATTGPVLGDAVTDWWEKQKEKNRKIDASRERRPAGAVAPSPH